MVQALTTVLLAAGVGLALAALSYLALRKPVATVGLVLGVWILTVALRDTVLLSVTVSDFQVFPADILAVLLGGVGLARTITHGIGGVARGLALALLALLVIHITRGVADSGLQAGLNDGRQWLYFAAAVVYAATVPGGWDARVWRVFTGAGLLLAGVAAVYFLLEGVGTSSDVVIRDGELVTARPIFASGALLVLQAAILTTAVRWPSRQFGFWLGLGAGVAVVLVQHRTVWVAGLLVVAVGSVWWASRQQRDSVAFSAVGIVLLCLPLAVWAFASSGSLVESIAEPTSSNSTFAWRTTGWGGLISSHDSAAQLAGGDPSGSDWSRVINGGVVNVSAHNGFVDAYIRFGLPGVFILCWLGLLLWFRRGVVAAGVGLTPQAVGLLLLTQFVFSIAYSLDSIQGLMAGILISGLLATRPAGVRAVSTPHVTVPGYPVR